MSLKVKERGIERKERYKEEKGERDSKGLQEEEKREYYSGTDSESDYGIK